MSKLYNTQKEISSDLSNFIKSFFPNIRKTQLNIIPSIIFGMIMAESTSAIDISKELKDNFSFIQTDSVIKRIRRLFNNNLFDPYDFYSKFISHIIDNYKIKHSDNRIHIVFDHMFSHNNFTVFMLSLRVGKQGIPLWFKCFKGNNNPSAFLDSTIIEGITKVHNLFKDKNYDIIFLADRWFNSFRVLQHISSLGHTFCIRLKGNILIRYFDKHENHYLKKYASELFSYQHHSVFYHNCFLFDDSSLLVNLTISKRENVSEPWIIITNGDPKRAIKDYGYRFGAIESIFKNQKSNGFYIETNCNSSLKYFTSQYSLVCFAITFLTMFGSYFSKNKGSYKKVKLETHKNYIKDSIKKSVRVISLFNTGLTLFKRAFCSPVYIKIPYNMILYDI